MTAEILHTINHPEAKLSRHSPGLPVLLPRDGELLLLACRLLAVPRTLGTVLTSERLKKLDDQKQKQEKRHKLPKAK